jgi:flagellin-like hook-associated protein FlgL
MRVGGSLARADLTAQHNLLRAIARLSQSNVRLATMRRINRGSDDPAGLIAVEQLQAELTAIRAASDSAARAAGATGVADAALSEVGDLLNSVRGHVVAAAGGGLSDAEVAAKQMEIDAALEAINRIGASTSFAGRNLLDGGTMTFNFSPDGDQAVTLTIPAVHASVLGGPAGRLSDLAGTGSVTLADGDLTQAVEILDAAGAQVVEARARMGAFEKYTIESAHHVLDSMEENVSGAISLIYDTDVAAETSRLVGSEILVDAATAAVMLASRSASLFSPLVQGVL